jgi:ATP-dependent DNA ligase
MPGLAHAIRADPRSSGSSIQLGRSIMAKLQRITLDTSPFIAVPRPDAKDAKWAEPKLVCEVEFTQWTRDGRVRQPAPSQPVSSSSVSADAVRGRPAVNGGYRG